MRISFFVYNLSGNPIVRVHPLAQAMKHLGHEVEMIGFVIPEQGIYKPYAKLYTYKTLPYPGFGLEYKQLAPACRKLARLATGEICYACKPLLETMLPALFASKFGIKCPVILDAEDNDLILHNDKKINGFVDRIKYIYRCRSYMLRRLLVLFFRHRTIASSNLQKQFGGSLVLHGPDDSVFNPTLASLNQTMCRKAFNLPLDKTLILFAGVPRFHKGVDVLTDAVLQTPDNCCNLVFAGPDDPHEIYSQQIKKLGSRGIWLGPIDYEKMPQLLSACDVIAIPQRSTWFSEFQMPAKLLEGMAMGKACLTTSVSDAKKMLYNDPKNPCGWVVLPEDVKGLSDAINLIASDPAERKRRGEAARSYYMENASVQATSLRLKKVIDNAISMHHKITFKNIRKR